MFIHYRTRGFILKKVDRGEADQLFTIFTKDFGKLEILGKGIRKIFSKLKSGMELFNLSEIEFIQGKSQKTLTDAILIERFGELRHNLDKLQVAYKISEVLDSLVKGEEPDEKIWQLLSESLERLNDRKLKIENRKLKIFYYYFLWNLFSLLGYQPELYHCVYCQKKLLPEQLYFSPKEGGIICQKCGQNAKLENKIRIEVVKILRIIVKGDWKTLMRLRMENEHFKSLEENSLNYTNFILEKNSKLI